MLLAPSQLCLNQVSDGLLQRRFATEINEIKIIAVNPKKLATTSTSLSLNSSSEPLVYASDSSILCVLNQECLFGDKTIC